LEDGSSESSDDDGEIPVTRTSRPRGAIPRQAVQRQRAVGQAAVESTEPAFASQERPVSRVHTLSDTRPSTAIGSQLAEAPQSNEVQNSVELLPDRAGPSVSPNAAIPQEDDQGAHEAEAIIDLDATDRESAVGASIALDDADDGNDAGPAQLVAKDVTASSGHQGGKEAISGPSFVDVAVQTLAEEHSSQSHQPSIPSPKTRAMLNRSSIDTISDPELPDEISEHHQDPSGKNALIGDQSVNAKHIRNVLQAWISSMLPGLSSGSGASLGIMELSLPEAEIVALLQKQDAQNYSTTEALHELNPHQRHLVLAHINAMDSDLLYVGVWHNESISTVFGVLDITSLVVLGPI
jgi:hypothetical protein